MQEREDYKKGSEQTDHKCMNFKMNCAYVKFVYTALVLLAVAAVITLVALYAPGQMGHFGQLLSGLSVHSRQGIEFAAYLVGASAVSLAFFKAGASCYKNQVENDLTDSNSENIDQLKQ